MPRPQSKPPQPYEQFGQDFPSVIRAYEALGEACHESGPLDGKSRELVKLGIAIGAGLESATHAHARLAREAGATVEELRQVALLATTTVGFPTAMRALTWITDVSGKEAG